MKYPGAAYSPTSRQIFFFGLALFVAVKLLWTWIPVVLMGMPRLGDDALVYLWWGRNNFVGLTSPAVTDVLNLHHLGGYVTPEHIFDRNRVTMRVIGAVPSPGSLLLGGLVTAGVDPKIIFALQETMVLAALALGLGVLFHFLFGATAGGIAFVFLAFAFVPIQGLHYLIPGVLALSLALMLFVLVTRDKPNVLAIFAVALLTLLTHQIGLIYVAVASALYVLHSIVQQRTHWRRADVLAAIAAAGLVAFIWAALFGAMPESTAGRGAISFLNVAGNAAGMVRRWWGVSTGLVIGLAGLAWGLAHFRLRSPITLLAVVVSGAIVASVTYDIPGYPGDVGLRLIVVLFILACGGAGAALASVMNRPFGKLLVVACVGAFACFGAVNTYRLMIKNANGRYHLLDYRELRQAIAEVPANATILYAEADIALMSALLVGGERLGAIPYPMIQHSPHLQGILRARKPTLMALVPPRELSGSSVAYASGGYSAVRASLAPRSYGYRFAEFRRIEIAKPPETEALFVRLEPLGSVDRISISASSAGSAVPCASLRLEPVTASSTGWYRLTARGCSTIALEAAGAPGAAAISGLSLSEPNLARCWPWGSAGVRLRAMPRRNATVVDVDFSWQALLASNEASGLRPFLGGTPVLVTDRGGIIFATVEIE